jgi:hypothetical protein
MMMSTLAAVSPVAHGADVTVEDVMSRMEAGASSTHTITATLASTLAGSDVVTLDFVAAQNDSVGTPHTDASGFVFTGLTITDSGTCNGAAAPGSEADEITFTNGGSDCGPGTTIVLAVPASTNPAVGNYIGIISAASSDVTGQFALNMITDDTINILATVDPTISFIAMDLDSELTCDADWNRAATTASSKDGNYVIDFGSLNTAVITQSGGNSKTITDIEYICTQGSTNATSGMAVTMESANGANGLVSVSTSDEIPSDVTGALTVGNPAYGVCQYGSLDVDSGVTPSAIAPLASGDFDTAANECGTSAAVVALTGAAQEIWSTTGVTQDATSQLDVRVVISDTQEAHNDYTDALTFVATGTF